MKIDGKQVYYRCDRGATEESGVVISHDEDEKAHQHAKDFFFALSNCVIEGKEGSQKKSFKGPQDYSAKDIDDIATKVYNAYYARHPIVKCIHNALESLGFHPQIRRYYREIHEALETPQAKIERLFPQFLDQLGSEWDAMNNKSELSLLYQEHLQDANVKGHLSFLDLICESDKPLTERAKKTFLSMVENGVRQILESQDKDKFPFAVDLITKSLTKVGSPANGWALFLIHMGLSKKDKGSLDDELTRRSGLQ